MREREEREGDIGEHGARRNQWERKERGRPMSKDKRFFKTLTPLINFCLLSRVPHKTFTCET